MVIENLESYIADINDRIKQNERTIYRRQMLLNNSVHLGYADTDEVMCLKELEKQLLNYYIENELLRKYRNMLEDDITVIKKLLKNVISEVEKWIIETLGN